MNPWLDDGDARLYVGDVRDVLDTLDAASVQTCVSSPPYWGLRDYGVDGQIGLEASPDAYVAELVDVYRAVRRVLRPDGTAWLNIGDSYVSKDLVGIPWRVAFALQADGWWLRSAIIWAKPNPMPESTRDRPTSSYEHVFLLSASERYFYDADAIREPLSANWTHGAGAPMPERGAHVKTEGSRGHQAKRVYDEPKGANARNVWMIATEPYPDAHIATFPEELPRRCIAAGSALGDLVLDPFAGSGTTLHVARKMGRRSIGVELNPAYAELVSQRLAQGSLLNHEGIAR